MRLFLKILLFSLYFLICIPLTIFGVMTGLLCSYFGRAFVAGYGSGPEIVNEMFTAVFRE